VGAFPLAVAQGTINRGNNRNKIIPKGTEESKTFERKTFFEGIPGKRREYQSPQKEYIEGSIQIKSIVKRDFEVISKKPNKTKNL
jgi:hypothetical protein